MANPDSLRIVLNPRFRRFLGFVYAATVTAASGGVLLPPRSLPRCW